MREVYGRPTPKRTAVGSLGGGGGPGRADAVDYIAAMTNDLRRLARRNGFETLAFLLDMAQLEADILKKTDTRES